MGDVIIGGRAVGTRRRLESGGRRGGVEYTQRTATTKPQTAAAAARPTPPQGRIAKEAENRVTSPLTLTSPMGRGTRKYEPGT